jgi:hypothetical protein
VQIARSRLPAKTPGSSHPSLIRRPSRNFTYLDWSELTTPKESPDTHPDSHPENIRIAGKSRLDGFKPSSVCSTGRV